MPSEICVYTIIHSDSIAAALQTGRLVGRERKAWKSAALRLGEARAHGDVLPIVLADASNTERLLACGVLEQVDVQETSTTYTVTQLRVLRGRTQQDLRLWSTGKAIAVGFIRPYALCHTPPFVKRALRDAGRTELALVPEELIGLEGEAYHRMSVHRSREARLRAAKLRSALEANGGRLVCEVPRCGFDFERAYGELGRGYAHVHHKRPLSERDGDEVTRLEDLAVVCANCHAMIHLGNQCRPLDALIRDHQ